MKHRGASRSQQNDNKSKCSVTITKRKVSSEGGDLAPRHDNEPFRRIDFGVSLPFFDHVFF